MNVICFISGVILATILMTIAKYDVRKSCVRSNKIIELCLYEGVYCNVKVFGGSAEYYISVGDYRKSNIKTYEEAKFFIDSAKKF